MSTATERKDAHTMYAGATLKNAAPASRYAVVLAAGEGHRFGSETPKQFLDLCGKPLLWWSLKAFHDADPATRLVLVLHPGYFSEWDALVADQSADEQLDVLLCAGGRSRLESVSNSLISIAEDGASPDALVAVHDAARPLLLPAMIERGWRCCDENGSAVPVVKVCDSLRRLTDDGSEAVDRNDYVAVQTPQVFPFGLLCEAYGQEWDAKFTDDASLVGNLGRKIHLYDGEVSNIKVTNPLDIEVATVLMKSLNRSDAE